MTNLHGYNLACALRKESTEIAREDRAALMLEAAQEIEMLLRENRSLEDSFNKLTSTIEKTLNP